MTTDIPPILEVSYVIKFFSGSYSSGLACAGTKVLLMFCTLASAAQPNPLGLMYNKLLPTLPYPSVKGNGKVG